MKTIAIEVEYDYGDLVEDKFGQKYEVLGYYVTQSCVKYLCYDKSGDCSYMEQFRITPIKEATIGITLE